MKGNLFCLRRPAKEGPTIHAFAHSLSTIIDYHRLGLTKCPPSEDELRADKIDLHLMSIWTKYSMYEEYLVALANLCDRVRRDNFSGTYHSICLIGFLE